MNREKSEITVVLLLSGLDPTGGAGLLLDAAVCVALECHPAGVATALTVQDTTRVHRWIAAPPGLLYDQLMALLSDMKVAAVKVGMLADGATVSSVTRAIEGLQAPIVLDPVLRAKDGTPLLRPAAIRRLMERFFPLCTLLTPNAEEASLLSGMPVQDLEGAARAAHRIHSATGCAVLVKGGHLQGDRSTDVLFDGHDTVFFSHDRASSGRLVHGTGCMLSTAVACSLAHGCDLRLSVERARTLVCQAFGHLFLPGKGNALFLTGELPMLARRPACDCERHRTRATGLPNCLRRPDESGHRT